MKKTTYREILDGVFTPEEKTDWEVVGALIALGFVVAAFILVIYSEVKIVPLLI